MAEKHKGDIDGYCDGKDCIRKRYGKKSDRLGEKQKLEFTHYF